MGGPSSGGQAGSSVGQAPAVGTVRGNFKFKGGNPADPSNWESI